MPYKLRKAPKRDLYWVIAQDGKHMSKEPIPKERAEAQIRALYASERQQKGGSKTRPSGDEYYWNSIYQALRDKIRDLADRGILARSVADAAIAKGEGPAFTPEGITEFDCDAIWYEVIHHIKPLAAKAELNSIHTPDDHTGLGRGGALHGGVVLSPNDKYERIIAKVLVWVNAGVLPPIVLEAIHIGHPPITEQHLAMVRATLDPILDENQMSDIDAILNGNVDDDDDDDDNNNNDDDDGNDDGNAGNMMIDVGAGNRHSLHGAGPIPELSVLQQIAKAAYSTSPPQEIGPFVLRNATPTLKFYVLKDPDDARLIDTVIVGIRGTNTSDKQDLYADAKLALGQLGDTPRWTKDLADFNSFMSRIPNPKAVDVYGVGHSLGGAVLDMFLKAGLIKKGVSYNPAISMGDAQKDIPNRRIYQEGDPLLAIMGRSARNVEIRPPKKKEQSVGRRIANAASYFIPYVGLVTKGMDTLDAHALDNFTGGAHSRQEQEWINNLNEVLSHRGGAFIIPARATRQPLHDFLLNFAMRSNQYIVEGEGGWNARHTIRLARPLPLPPPLLLQADPRPQPPRRGPAEEIDDPLGVVEHLGLGRKKKKSAEIMI